MFIYGAILRTLPRRQIDVEKKNPHNKLWVLTSKELLGDIKLEFLGGFDIVFDIVFDKRLMNTVGAVFSCSDL